MKYIISEGQLEVLMEVQRISLFNSEKYYEKHRRFIEKVFDPLFDKYTPEVHDSRTMRMFFLNSEDSEFESPVATAGHTLFIDDCNLIEGLKRVKDFLGIDWETFSSLVCIYFNLRYSEYLDGKDVRHLRNNCPYFERR